MRKLNVTDGQTDRQTDGRGALQYLPSRASGAAGDKNGQTGDFNNYRPISVLPFFSKLLEKLVYNRMLKLIDDFNVIHHNQFGFRRNRSTYMALNVLLDKFHESVTSKEYIYDWFIYGS